jgi:hypothetical protein
LAAILIQVLQSFLNLGKRKIVAKVTQCPYGLLFFCNLLFPEQGHKKGEQNTNEQTSYPGEIDSEIPPAEKEITRKPTQPRNFRHEQEKNP